MFAQSIALRSLVGAKKSPLRTCSRGEANPAHEVVCRVKHACETAQLYVLNTNYLHGRSTSTSDGDLFGFGEPHATGP